jgi:putative tricarboxylic transport membrane protein
MGRNNRRRSHRVKWVERSETKKRLGIHEALAPFTLALVLGNRAEDAFRLSMIGSAGNLRVFWSNGLVGSITTLALILLFWPLISQLFERASRLWRPAGGSRTA